MTFDDRPEPAKRLEQARRKRGFKTPKEAATFHGWKYETYIQHEQGHRGIARASTRYAKAFRVSEAWLLTGEGNPGPPLSEKLRSVVTNIQGYPVALQDRVASFAVFEMERFDKEEDTDATPDT